MVRWKQIEWTWNFANEEWLLSNSISRVRELRRLVFAESTEQDTVRPFVRLSRRLRSVSTARNFLAFRVSHRVVMLVPSAARTLWRELASVFGSARSAERSSLEVLGLLLLLLPWLWDPRFRDFAVLRLRLKLIFDSWNSDWLFVNKQTTLHKDSLLQR